MHAASVASIHGAEKHGDWVLDNLDTCCLPQYLGHPQQLTNKLGIKSSQWMMGTYLLTLLVTVEQEQAIQQLFLTQCWEYTKLVDRTECTNRDDISGKMKSEAEDANATVERIVGKTVKEARKTGEENEQGFEVGVNNGMQGRGSGTEIDWDEQFKDGEVICTNNNSGTANRGRKATITIEVRLENENGTEIETICKTRGKTQKGKVAVCSVKAEQDSNDLFATDMVSDGYSQEDIQRLDDVHKKAFLSDLETDPNIYHYSKLLSNSVTTNEECLPDNLADGYNTELSAYICTDCGYVFPNESYYLGHKIEEKCLFPCEHCSEVFSFRNSSEFQKHLQSHSIGIGEDKRERVDGTFLNMAKPMDSAASSACKLHDILEADEEDDTASVLDMKQESDDEDMSGVSTNGQDSPSELMCEICQRTYRSVTALKAHMKFHDSHSYRCDMCDKTYPIYSYLKRHMASHTGARHDCSECGKVFTREYTLQQHISVKHSKTSKLACKPCGKQFSSKEHMWGHLIAKHGAEKKFTCHKCGKMFGYKKNMLYHCEKVCGKVRAGEGFQCDICGKEFTSQKGLKQHVTLHSDPSFECGVCNRKFRWRASFRKHLEVCSQRTVEDQDPCQAWLDLHVGAVIDPLTQSV